MKVAFTSDGEIRYAFAYCKPLDMLRRDGYYITNNVDFSYNNEGECTLSVMIDYERIYN